MDLSGGSFRGDISDNEGPGVQTAGYLRTSKKCDGPITRVHMQATFDSFKPKQAEEWGCKDCQVRHRLVEIQGKPKVKCDLRGIQDVETHCRLHLDKAPLTHWPALPDNYEAPKKYRGKW